MRVLNFETLVGDAISASDKNLWFVHIFPSKLPCHQESFKCDLARGEKEVFFLDKSLLYYIHATDKLKHFSIPCHIAPLL